jgi:hypothetical protein
MDTVRAVPDGVLDLSKVDLHAAYSGWMSIDVRLLDRHRQPVCAVIDNDDLVSELIALAGHDSPCLRFVGAEGHTVFNAAQAWQLVLELDGLRQRIPDHLADIAGWVSVFAQRCAAPGASVLYVEFQGR